MAPNRRTTARRRVRLSTLGPRPSVLLRPSTFRSRPSTRRGVILLVVLSVLVLFTLVAITFVILSTQHRISAVASNKHVRYDEAFPEHLERAMLQIVRDTSNPNSKLMGHSILADFYGSDGVLDHLASTTAVPPDVADGFGPLYHLGSWSLMFIDVPISGNDRIFGNGDDYNLTSGYYNGRVITMLNGPAGGQSTRIVGYVANLTGDPLDFDPTSTADILLLPAEGRILMQPFDGMVTTSSGWDMSLGPQAGNFFFINGRPFNGSGAGYNNGEPFTDSDGNGVYTALPPEPYTDVNGNGSYDFPTGFVNATDPHPLVREYALLPFAPHPLGASTATPITWALEYYTYLCGRDGLPGVAGFDDNANGIIDAVGGQPDIDELGWPGSDDVTQFAVDEDYDAPDYQNMLLAARIWNSTKTRWEIVLPSLVRPDLIRYWVNRYIDAGFDFTDTSPTNLAAIQELFSRIFPRPLAIGDPSSPTSGIGHPQFTGGNPLLSLMDLTTDVWPPGMPPGNGIPDSIDRLYEDTVIDVDTDGDGTFDSTDGFPDCMWDVDNDGDGLADSIWVDLGLPVQTAPDGRQYKPLFAILIIDMDGRGNINAHGNSSHFGYDPAAAAGTPSEFYVGRRDYTGTYAYPAGGTADDTQPLSPGLGYSVGDVNLAFLLPTPYFNTSIPQIWQYPAVYGTVNEYRQLLLGRPPIDLPAGLSDVPALPGRYGEPHLYYSSGEYIVPVGGGGDATLDWLSRYIPAGGLVPLPGITSTGLLPPGSQGNGFDDTAGTADDLYDGDDNIPARPMAGVSSASLRHTGGNFYSEGFLFSHALGNHGSPGDVDGNGGLALDVRGQPYYVLMGQINPGPDGVYGTVDDRPEAVDEPYEMDLSLDAQRKWTATSASPPGTTRQVDSPFTPGELEYLLRYFDVDASTLPNRIAQLAPATVANAFNRGLITTENSDLPGPNIAPTPELRDYLVNTLGVPATNLHVSDLFAARLVAGLGLSLPLSPTESAAINANLAMMMAPELAAGLRIDLNRPLGNACDDDGDGVVDDPDEVLNIDDDGDLLADYTDPASLFAAGVLPTAVNKRERLWWNSTASSTGIPFDNDNNGAFDAHDMLARHYLARHLYCLMMLLKDSGYYHPTFEDGISAAEEEELTARRIAQWAVNAVDFRDRDSIMTPFEYDLHPFDDDDGDGIAWEVDGWVGTNPGPNGYFDGFAPGGDDTIDDSVASNPERRLVWGCESPDLLLTEDISGHDRRVEDLANDNAAGGGDTVSGSGMDDDFDQQRIPQGWTFIELYCTRNPNNPAYQGDLYNTFGQLDLGRLAPPNADGDVYAVWRLAITESRIDDGAAGGGDPENNVFRRLYGTPTDPEYQPDSTIFEETRRVVSPGVTVPAIRMNLFDGADTIDIDRIVWLAPYAPSATAVDDNRVYYNRAAAGSDVLLNPGQYAVVGPRRTTVGGGDENVTVVGFEPVGTDPAPQRFNLGDSGAGIPFSFSDNSGGLDYVYPTDAAATLPAIKYPLGIAVAGERADGRDIGLSVSEPLFSAADYYPSPTPGQNTTDAHDGSLVWNDLYDADPAAAGIQSFDEPFDNTRLLDDEDLLVTGTTENYRTVFLQRLANPVWPWNPEPFLASGAANPEHDPALPVNPYMTVDWMPLDLTVYNSLARPPAGPADEDPDDPGDPDDKDTDDIQFASRQRGENDDDPDNFLPDSPRRGPGTQNLWSPISDDPIRVTAAAGYSYTNPNQTLHDFRHLMDHTFGYVNLPYQDTTVGVGGPYYGNPDPYGYTDSYDATVTTHTGDPVRPFAWLTWNNRPYASAMELLLVPSSSPSRLLYEHDIRRDTTDGDYADHYTEKESTAAPDELPDEGPPFNHLLNLFYSSDTDDVPGGPRKDPTATPPAPDGSTSNYHRIFEFVEVPSRFSGTDEMLNPLIFTGTTTFPASFHPPFNRISRNREPGRVNINTIFDNGSLLRALLNDYPDPALYPTPFASYLWESVVRSRRGYGPAFPPAAFSAAIVAPNTDSPSFFANPFRSHGSDYNVPLEDLRWRDLDSTSAGAERREFVETGLLRPDADSDNDRPLFAARADVTDAPDLDTTPWINATDPHRNANRNPFFRYQALGKLGNVLTTRSNVYAIWITVGFFEVERVPVDPYHPDGYSLGQELGADTGDVKRHRAFYLFDRTIPVGFQRGQNHNVHRGLLVERIVE